MIAMVQDRGAVNEPDSWAEFLSFVLEEVGEACDGCRDLPCGEPDEVGCSWAGDQVALLSPVDEVAGEVP